MNEQTDLGIPFRKFLSQRSAAGDEEANPAAHGLEHFGKKQPICQLPGERRRAFALKHLVKMRPADRDGPAVHRLLETDGNGALHLVVNFLVHTGHGDKDSGMKLAQDAWQFLDQRTIGDGDAAIQFSKIHMARSDVGEG